MNKNMMDVDEALARSLYEQDQLEMEAMHKADQELAKKLQQQHGSTADSHAIDLYDNVIDLTEDIAKILPSSSKNTGLDTDIRFFRDLQLARELERAEMASQNQVPFESDWTFAKKLENTVDESILNEEIPDLHQLFLFFNAKYFNRQLDMVEVKWSSKMTRCAGTCAFKNGNHCIVTLSEPLLKFRPKKDIFETLLHEMIHALLFITERNTDKDGHGPEFLKEAKRISDATNLKITVYHKFHSEVRLYLMHHWKCNGVCQNRPPYYGLVKRAMNRPPQLADSWYAEHQVTCGGTFTKIASPPPKEKPASKKRKRQENTLDGYFADTDEKMRKLKEF